MHDGFPPGSWGTGSPGDPDLDALLPQAAVESLLDGATRGVPEELAPLADTLAALRAAPSAVDLGAEERALAAFRALRAAGVLRGPTAGPLPGPAMPDDPDPRAHTLELKVPHGHAVGRRRGRARHRARPAAETRPAIGAGARSGQRRRSAGRRLALAIATAAAALVIVGVFAYAGPFQSVARSIGAPSAKRPATASSLPSSHAPNRSLTGSATLAPQPSTPAATVGGAGAAARECLAYFRNPWLPGVKSWDKADWANLAAAVPPPATLWAVWQYCQSYSWDSRGHLKQRVFAMLTRGGWPTPPGGVSTRPNGKAG